MTTRAGAGEYSATLHNFQIASCNVRTYSEVHATSFLIGVLSTFTGHTILLWILLAGTPNVVGNTLLQ